MSFLRLVHFLKVGVEIDERLLQINAAVIFVDGDFQCSELLYALREEIRWRCMERCHPVAIDASWRKFGRTSVTQFFPKEKHRSFQWLNLVGDGLLNVLRHPFDRQYFVLQLAQRVYKQNELFSTRVFVHSYAISWHRQDASSTICGNDCSPMSVRFARYVSIRIIRSCWAVAGFDISSKSSLSITAHL